MSVDTLREAQQYIDTVDYINKLKLRLEKLIAAAGALQKHGGHTVKVYEDFVACLELLATQEDKALKVFTSAKGVWWKRLSDLYAALIPTQREASDVMRSEFLDSLEEVKRYAERWSRRRGSKRVVDHYNRVTASIERIESKLSTMGVPSRVPNAKRSRRLSSRRAIYESNALKRTNVTKDAAQTWNRTDLVSHRDGGRPRTSAQGARRRTRSGGGEVVATSG